MTQITQQRRRAIVWATGMAVLVLLAVTGCYRGQSSKDTPIHLVPNMDNQPRYDPQGASPLFADGRTMRLPLPGTVAQGQLYEDVVFHTGLEADGLEVQQLPLPVTGELLARGRERFDIYCAPCHGRVGTGQGMVVKRGMLAPPTFHDDRLRDTTDGYLFGVISNGKGNMASYRYQLKPGDRWAVVAYLRALQRSQNASFDDLPPAVQNEQQDQAP